MEYLVFLKIGGGLFAAVIAAILIWRKKGSPSIDKAKELEDGNFAIPKPKDEFMEGVEYDEVRTDPIFKQDEFANERPPKPKGDPTIRP